MIWEFEDCARILEEMRPRIGRHDWAINLSRWSLGKGRRAQKRTESLIKRVFNPAKPLFVFEVSGLKVLGDRRDRYARGIAVEPDYEEASVASILESVAAVPGAVLDVGANMGVLMTLLASRTKERVISVEPDPETARRAACAVALNGLRNVTVVNAAIGDHVGEAVFFTAPGSSDAASLSGKTVDSPVLKEVRVPLVTIDSLVEQCGLEKVSFLKIDVEGYEPQAIAGAEQTVLRHHPELFFEYHWEIAPKLGWKAEDITAKLDQWGSYRYFVLHETDPVRDFPPTPEMGLSVNVWCRRG
ncbi:MAG: hypothetical protein HONBIEJF_03048 [Fimbriimonadaceae bacterium]|nr:hypothetical protein [Fimbriimonadaceae bacterium]